MLDCPTSEVYQPTVRFIYQWSKLTRIFRHQVDALGFMTDREIGELRDPMRYWRSGTDEDGTLLYVMIPCEFP